MNSAERGQPGIAPTSSTVRGEQRLAGLLLFAVGAWFLTAIMLGASIAPGYEYGSAAISDLGVIPETAALFNATLIAIGALNLVGGVLFFRTHRRIGVLTPFVIGSVGAIGAGVFPLDRGSVHSLFALVGFLFFNLEAIATGALAGAGLSRWLRAVSVVAGAVGLAFLVLMVLGDAGNAAAFGAIGHGGTERMIAYPVMIWLPLLGGHLLAGDASFRTA